MSDQLYSDLSKGSLLIASPEIDKGLYTRAVLLLCEHTSAGSFGLIINKEVEVEISEDLLGISPEILEDNVNLRLGGPMQPNQMMLLHSSNSIPDQTLTVTDGLYLGGDLDFLQHSMQETKGTDIVLCLGYSGWLTGQLEQEFLEGDWYVHPARKEHIFEVPSEDLWRTVLREMGGKYATLSMIPEDLELN